VRCSRVKVKCCSQKRTKSFLYLIKLCVTTGKKKKEESQNLPNPCAASAMITSAEHGCSLFVLSLFFLVVLVLLFAHEDANSRRRAAAEDDDDKSSLRSIIGFVWCALFFLKK
jgi:hypothetical protein